MPERTASPSEPRSLKQRIEYLEFLNSFQHEILDMIRGCIEAEDSSQEACLQSIVDRLANRIGIYAASVLVIDEPRQELVLLATASRDPKLVPALREVRVPLGQGLTGACAAEGAIIAANDVSEDPRYVRGPLEKTRSELCLPLKVAGKVVGVIDLQDEAPGRFTPEFVQLSEELALSISMGMELKKLHDDVRQYSEELERRVETGVRELRESENHYRQLVENAMDPILVLDTAGTLSYANLAARTLLGYAAQEFAGVPFTRHVAKGSVHRLYSLLRDVLDNRRPKPVKVEVADRTGQARTVELTAIPLSDGRQVRSVEIFLRDVTEQAAIENLRKNYLKKLEEEVVRRTSEIRDTQRASILAIATLAESIDEDTGSHLDRIRYYCKILAEELRKNPKYADEITDDYVELLFDLSPLHDLGKVGIRDYILLKRDKLTPEEMEVMKTHAEIGAKALRMAGQMIRRESIFAIGEMIARYHHERWDGTGYPAVDVNGELRPLKGEEIPLCARILAVADVYDALTSRRPYKDPLPHDWAKQRIQEETGKHFDPDVVTAFLAAESQILDVRRRYPDTAIGMDSPLRLPARDLPEIPEATSRGNGDAKP